MFAVALKADLTEASPSHEDNTRASTSSAVANEGNVEASVSATNESSEFSDVERVDASAQALLMAEKANEVSE